MGIAAGTVLAGRYRVIRPIGAGGMGEVYEADHEALGRRVAVKVLFDEDPKALARFEQEARALGRLAHPHVVKIIDFHGDQDGRRLLVMEMLEGQSLSQVMRREKTLEPARAMRIAREVLDALASAHDAGIIHRDIKPSNIFLERDRVKLIDFGIAKVIGGGGPKTTDGAVVGTASYLAPEQLMGLDVDARVDVRAVGLVLFEMLSGQKPWRTGAGGLELAAEIIREDPLTFADIGVEVDRDLDAVVRCAVARDPDARYPFARAMYEALRPVPKSPRVTLPMRTVVVAREKTEAPATGATAPLLGRSVAFGMMAASGILIVAIVIRLSVSGAAPTPIVSSSAVAPPVVSAPPVYAAPPVDVPVSAAVVSAERPVPAPPAAKRKPKPTPPTPNVTPWARPTYDPWTTPLDASTLGPPVRKPDPGSLL